MTKFAANITTLFNEVEFLCRFEKAYQSGFKAVEFLFPYSFNTESLKSRLVQFGLNQAMFNMPPGDWNKGERGLAALPGKEEEFQQSVETALIYARALNCKKLHTMSGNLNPSFSRQKHTSTFISNIRHAADRFAKYGIDILLEPLNSYDAPNYFMAYQRQAVDIIRLVERENVKLQMDLYHAQIMEGNLEVLIRSLAPFLGHVQIASVPHRHEPFSGEINYPYLIDILDDSGYTGWIGCEYFPQNVTEEGLSWIKPYL